MTSRADELQREIVLRMTGAERVHLASEMSAMARGLAIAGLRHRHPGWTEEEVREAFVRGVLAESSGVVGRGVLLGGAGAARCGLTTAALCWTIPNY